MIRPLLLPAFILPLAALSAELSAQTWAQLSPTPYPSALARRSGGIAYDPLQGKLLMYGGLQSGPTLTLSDTWTFDGATWTQLAPLTTPPPRWGHRMVLDTARLRIVTFGGRSPTTTATANDTWEWDGYNWQQIVTPTSPNARAFYSMAYDQRRGRMVLYGLQSGFGTGAQQTWEYDGTTWSLAATATLPPGLETPAMVYDKGRGVTVMFGGANNATLTNATYEYDGTDWTLRPTATLPIGRYRAGCDYDDLRGRVVVYGGFGNATALQDTWEYDGNDWTQVASVGPAKSTEAYVAYLPTLGQTLFFGGSGPGGTNNETWLYSGAGTAIAAPFGRGCATSAGVPTLQPTTRPVLGGTYTLTLGNGPAAALGVLAHGFSNTSSLLGALPVDLTLLGFAGCRLEVSPDASLVLVVVGGTASSSVTVPNAAALTGLQLYSQVLVLDAAAANGNGGATNAVHAVLGS